jgi:hypothetical protein
MKFYAKIDDMGYVSEIIIGEKEDMKNLVEIDPLIGIGSGWKYEDETFINANIIPEGSMTQYGEAKIPKQSILTDGFGRTGTSFLHKNVHDCFPDVFMRRGYQGRHVVKSLSIAPKKFGVVVITSRNPLDAITSALSYFPEQYSNAQEAADNYVIFMSALLKHKEKVMIVGFDDLINNTFDVMKSIGKNIDTEPLNLLSEYDPIASSKYSPRYLESLNLVKQADLSKAEELYNKVMQ